MSTNFEVRKVNEIPPTPPKKKEEEKSVNLYKLISIKYIC